MSQKIRLVLFSLWLGAMSFFSAFVAPAAFAVLPTRRMAGDVVSRTLGGLEYFGIAIAVLLLIALFFSHETKRKLFYFETVVTLAMLVSTLIARFIVAAKLHNIRVEYGDRLDAMAASDPVRVTFGTLHQASVGLTGFNMIAALVLIVILMFRSPELSIRKFYKRQVL